MQIIVVDEYSMVSLVSLEYINKVLKELFTLMHNKMFAGIHMMISGDGFQLPVMKIQGRLTKNEAFLSPIIKETFNFSIVNRFSLNEKFCSSNKRQIIFETLMRMRHAICNDHDVKFLNERYIDNISSTESVSIN